ncbi:ABC transporter permease [Halobacillus salinus]|uniref:ABC transporter permease n=1 Tax=Halobacillus salinus TaxID=192814 RepID=UPI0009A56F02|nr:ABC transporter permease [Halobacillus salinus]
MTTSIQRIYAIFTKDFKDLTKNLYVSTTFLLPLFYAFMLGRGSGMDSAYFLPLMVNMTFATVGTYIQSAIIAEEKENGTLRGLMLSPATTLEILTGKSVLSVLCSVVVFVVSLEFFDGPMTIPSAAWIGFIIMTIFYITLGTLVGLLSKSLMESSIFILPVIFILGMGTMFRDLVDEYAWFKVVEWMPNYQFEQLFQASDTSTIVAAIGWMIGWTALVVVVTLWLYQKRSFDE